MSDLTPLRPEPTADEILSMQRCEDWASREIAERIGDRLYDTRQQFRAVRALREGRQAFLAFGGSYFHACYASIANDHGEAAARAWARGDGDPEVVAWYGRPGEGTSIFDLLDAGEFVVVDPPAVRFGRAA